MRDFFRLFVSVVQHPGTAFPEPFDGIDALFLSGSERLSEKIPIFAGQLWRNKNYQNNESLRDYRQGGGDWQQCLSLEPQDQAQVQSESENEAFLV